MDEERMALMGKGLAHPARVRILRMLASQSECMGAQVFGGLDLAQSTVSQHMATLKAAGLVHSHAAGQGQVYCLDVSAVREFAEELSAIIANAPACHSTEVCR